MPDQVTDIEAVDILHRGGMAEHPLVAFQVDFGLKTGDWTRLEATLHRHPWILAQARNRINTEEYQRAQNPFRPYPTPEEVELFLSSGRLLLGYIDDDDNRLRIDWDTLCRPTINLGMPGGGKSSLAKYILWQALLNDCSFNVLIPDLKKEYRHLNLVAPRLKVLPADRFRYNPLELPPWQQPMDHLMAFAEVFVSENYLAGTSLNLLIDLCVELYRERGIFDGARNFPTLADLHDLVSRRLSGTKSFRYADILLWLQNRLKPYTLQPAFRAERGIPFRVFQEENLVMEMDAGFTDNMYNFVVASIVNNLFLFNKARGLGGARLRHLVNIDEARVLFQPHRDLSTFGESVINVLVSKTRDLGIGFLVSSQEPASLSQTLLSLASTKIAFPLTDGQDLDKVQKSFGLDDDQAAYMFQMPPFGQAIVSYVGFERPLLMGAPWFRLKRQLDDRRLEERMSGFWDELYKNIATNDQQTSVDVRTQLPVEAAAMLYHLKKHPFPKETALAGPGGFGSRKEAAAALAWLRDHGFVSIERYNVSGTKPSNYVFLTEKALGYLGLEGQTGPGKGGNEHRLFQYLVARRLAREGWKVKVEGRLDQAGKAVDVMAAKDDCSIAYEVTLSFGNLLDNIEADLRAGFSEVFIVCRNRTEMHKAMEMVGGSGRLAEPELERVAYTTIDRFRA